MRAIFGALAMAAVLAGCESGPSWLEPKPDVNRLADVEVEDAEGAKQMIRIEAGSDQASLEAIKAAQMSNFAEAEAKAAAAIKDDKDPSFKELYSYAVILERNGKYKEAIVQFEAANRKQSDSRCVDGKKRCEAKAGG